MSYSEEDENNRRVPNLFRGVTFPSDNHTFTENATQNIKESVRPSLGRQVTGCSLPTVHSKSSQVKSSTNRTSPMISLRSPDGALEFHEQPVQEEGCRSQLAAFIMSQNFEMFAGFVILGNFVTIILETDARAKMYDEAVDSDGYKQASDVLSSCNAANFAFLVFYAAECLARICSLRKAFFGSQWNIFDLIIVVVGAVGEVLDLVFGSSSDGSSSDSFQVLRILRMLRLLRAARVVISFKELYQLIAGMSSCLRTLVWAAGLVFLMLTMWSITAVEFLHPFVSELSKEGFYDDCTYCSQSFSNIMLANLTFFQIVSGDGWCDLARPLIMKHPWTAVLFIGVIFTMVFGMLNLITAVIVDTAAQAREADVLHMAAQKEYERKYAWQTVASICVGMDTDNDGNITLEELKRSAGKNPELSAHLSVMGVEFHDLQMVFDMLDSEQHGKIPIGEFVNQLYKMQTHEHKTTHVFVKHYVEEIRKDVKMMKKLSDDWCKQNSEDPIREPETEPKLESPPWIPLYPEPQETGAKRMEVSAADVASDAIPHHKGLPQVQGAASEAKQEPAIKLHPHDDDPAAKSCTAKEWKSRTTQRSNSSPKGDCSSGDDLELGQCVGIDDAISQFQNGAFHVLASAPTSNFAQQFIAKPGNTEQKSNQSRNTSPLPSLLVIHRQELDAHRHPSPPKKR